MERFISLILDGGADRVQHGPSALAIELEPPMSTAEEYRTMAERCLRVAKTTHNKAVGQMLRAMADDYLVRAALAESTPALQQQCSQRQPLDEESLRLP
jgi:hypothetical protein